MRLVTTESVAFGMPGWRTSCHETLVSSWMKLLTRPERLGAVAVEGTACEGRKLRSA